MDAPYWASLISREDTSVIFVSQVLKTVADLVVVAFIVKTQLSMNEICEDKELGAACELVESQLFEVQSLMQSFTVDQEKCSQLSNLLIVRHSVS